MAAKSPKPSAHTINNHKNTNQIKKSKNNSLTKNLRSDDNNINSNNIDNIRQCNRNDRIVSNIDCNKSSESHIGDGFLEKHTTPYKPTCRCSNITIMHLFHEMKQEFPTIPDHIVAQCVNENCHNREICILMLRNELALNPIPVQSYPARVFQRQQQQPKLNQESQQHTQHQDQNLISTPLKTYRVAPSISSTECDAIYDFDGRNEQLNSAENKHVDTSKSVANFIGGGIRKNAGVNEVDNKHIVSETPKRRPTTLDLNLSQQQQRLRQQLNVQLQQHLQHRQTLKPAPNRKAPLPPIPPKPSQVNNRGNTSSPPNARTAHHQNSSSNISLSSPMSSGESEISVHVGSSPLASSVTKSTRPDFDVVQAFVDSSRKNYIKSPKRHRSVINVQPELSYSPCSPLSSISQKSFTSVNLTLRQPNASVTQSTIDITAGPGASGASPGLTYSSTSYDARRGYQKNFHITVSTEGGVFSASRIRPHVNCNPINELKLKDAENEFSGVNGSTVNLLQSSESEQDTQMCLYQASCNEFSEVLHRQTMRRDKLSTALRDNKKKLIQVEQEINLLTEALSPGESERLDIEIQGLRCDCEVMLNHIENSKRNGLSVRNSPSYIPNPLNIRQLHISQPFPHRQRHPGPQIMTPGCQPFDFVQRHVGPTPSSAISSPNQQAFVTLLPTYQQLQEQRQQQFLLHQYHQPQLQALTADEDYSDSNVDSGDEDNNAALEMWPCSLCTFRNHPQLNTCECCENIRILPGTIRIIPSSSSTQTNSSLLSHFSASSAAHANKSPLLTIASSAKPTAINSPAANETASVNPSSSESDVNVVTQQQLKQFALHT